MQTINWVSLSRRRILSLSGNDARPFLQGLITNDIDGIAPSRAIYAALLTPQGRFLHDFFIAQCGDRLFVDTDMDHLPDLLKRLGMYRLRAKVDIRDESGQWRVIALPGDSGRAISREPWPGCVIFADPRDPALGSRIILPADFADTVIGSKEYCEVDFNVYERLRISRGVPDGAVDCIQDKTLALEGRLDECNGISFEKGCYVGQEVTTRMKHRNLVKRSLVPVSFDGPPPEPGSPVTSDDLDAGEIRSGVDGLALAMVRLDLARKGGLETRGRSLLLAGPV